MASRTAGEGVDHELLWQPSQRGGQGQGLAQAQPVAAGHRRPGADQGDVRQPVDAAGARRRPGRVDDDRQARPVPGLDQLAQVTAALDDANAGPGRAHPSCYQEAGGVVTPVGMPDARNEHVVQPRSMLRSRKWVAHDMQGPWLRMACSERSVSSA